MNRSHRVIPFYASSQQALASLGVGTKATSPMRSSPDFETTRSSGKFRELYSGFVLREELPRLNYSHDDLNQEIEIRFKRSARAEEALYWKECQGSKPSQEPASQGECRDGSSPDHRSVTLANAVRSCRHLGETR